MMVDRRERDALASRMEAGVESSQVAAIADGGALRIERPHIRIPA